MICRPHSARPFVLFVSLIFSVVSLAILVAGVYGTIKVKNFEDQVSLMTVSSARNMTIAVAVVGAVALIGATFGFFGLSKRKKGPLILYGVILCIVALAEIGLGSAALSLGGGEYLDRTVKDKWNAEHQSEVIEFQNFFSCCGYNVEIPVDFGCPSVTKPAPYCRDEVSSRLHQIYFPSAIAAIVLGAIESIAVIGICVMVCSNSFGIDDEDEYNYAKSSYHLHLKYANNAAYGMDNPNYDPMPSNRSNA